MKFTNKAIKQILAHERVVSPGSFWAKLSVAGFRRAQNRLRKNLPYHTARQKPRKTRRISVEMMRESIAKDSMANGFLINMFGSVIQK